VFCLCYGGLVRDPVMTLAPTARMPDGPEARWIVDARLCAPDNAPGQIAL